MAYDQNNVFARILRGEIPAQKVFEDDSTLAFMDVMPQSDGHTLVGPTAGTNVGKGRFLAGYQRLRNPR